MSSLHDAISLHRAGHLAQAEAAYTALLHTPDAAHATHLLGLIAAQRNDLDHAATLIRQALSLLPDNPEFWLNLGEIERRRDRPQAALDALQRAIDLAPRNAFAHYNLGIALRALARHADAFAAFHHALSLDPALLEAWNNAGLALLDDGQPARAADLFNQLATSRGGQALPAEIDNNHGRALWDAGHHQAALAAFQRAATTKPAFAPAWANLGAAFVQLGRHADAVDAYRKASSCEPSNAQTLLELATALLDAGQFPDAERTCRRALALDPANPVAHRTLAVILAQHLDRRPDALAAYDEALRLAPTPPDDWAFEAAALAGDAQHLPRAPERFVRDLFDHYALKFDDHLHHLGYHIPEELAKELLRSPPTPPPWNIIDLGCGTGLCGLALHPHARSLTGIDLSPKMLEQARKREIYTALLVGDVVASLLQLPESSADVIVAGDVFIYIGDLLPLFHAAYRALRPSGRLAFSTEATPHPTDPYTLLPRGRYGHSPDYLRACAHAAHLHVLSMHPTFIRADVPLGILTVLQKLS